jgi:hypothetical protein
LLALLKNDPQFREEVRQVLARDEPAVLAAGEQVQRQLEQAPEAVTQEFVTGARPVTDFDDRSGCGT